MRSSCGFTVASPAGFLFTWWAGWQDCPFSKIGLRVASPARVPLCPVGGGSVAAPSKRTLSHGLCCSICYYKKLLCWVLGWASKCVLCSSERADARRGSWCCSCWLSLALTVWRSVFPGASDFNTLNFHGDRRLLRCFGFVAFRRSSVSGVGGGRTISSQWHGLLGVTVNSLDEHQLPVAGLSGEHVGQLIALRAPLCEVRQEL